MAAVGMPGLVFAGGAPITNISQCRQPALARLARQAKPPHRANNFRLRGRQHLLAGKTPKWFACLNEDWSLGSPLLVYLDPLARRARAKKTRHVDGGA